MIVLFKDGFVFAGQDLDAIEHYKNQGYIEKEMVQDFNGNWITPEYAVSEEYHTALIQHNATLRLAQIEEELADLDMKRIRAMCEPEIKDEATGQTWLEYYNAQVAELRVKRTQKQKEGKS
jgi:hypothetical protein